MASKLTCDPIFLLQQHKNAAKCCIFEQNLRKIGYNFSPPCGTYPKFGMEQNMNELDHQTEFKVHAAVESCCSKLKMLQICSNLLKFLQT